MSAYKRRKTESIQGEHQAEDVDLDSEIDEELKDASLEKLAERGGLANLTVPDTWDLQLRCDARLPPSSGPTAPESDSTLRSSLPAQVAKPSHL
ncbi:hypothetical protein AAVH_23934 [Aphelenchoides avenae]|nr:hypothetical protein AAVH_23934 [Aphelenchus avenae]